MSLKLSLKKGLAFFRRRRAPRALPAVAERGETRLVSGPVQPRIPRALAAEGAAVSEELCLRPGHQVELVCNGHVFEAFEEEVAEARESVHLCIYIWRPGVASERLVRALEERARAGVACRLVVDALGSHGGFEREIRPRLERAGCQVRRFHPPRLLHPLKLFLRNHRKLLVVDGRVGLTGGWCISDEWLGDGRHPEAWRDTNVRVRGPAALAQMQAAFSQDWQHSGGEPLPPASFPPLEPEGPTRAAFVYSFPRHGAEAAERMLAQVFSSARRRLWISSGYFALNEAFTRLLLRQRLSGVDVRVLVPGPINDVRVARIAQRSTYGRLLAHGVRVWEYQPAMMHAKTALVDEQRSVVGSTNLDPFSLNLLEEGSLVVDEPALNAALARAFEEDLQYSREVLHAPWYGALVSLIRRAVWWVFDLFD